ncbi:DUF438 domain-containing protein [Lactobacillus intestinalis]|nr:DUF438 domain-containing protein [Lactobacillus intestinalis]UTW40460.1 DUF438 domain-containing protein [Lactobacillus intestinalis]
MMKEDRQKAILEILHYIHDGGDFDTAKKMFQDRFDQVDVSEITEAECELIAGGLDPSQIQYLCNVHAEVFKGNIKQNELNSDFEKPGHPVNTLKLENIVIKSLINDYLLPNLEKWEEDPNPESITKIQKALSDLATIDKHYRRKETSIFPIMNKYGITAPPEVMWGVDDDIRNLIKNAQHLANQAHPEEHSLAEAIKKASHEVLEMIFKEEEIMIPMLDEVATSQDWYNVKLEEKQIGYTLIATPMNWKPKMPETTSGAISIDKLTSLAINFKEGSLNLKQLEAILDILPFALTFIDENDKVTYFGGGASIYPHSKNVLGNSVFSCHPAKSRPIIHRIFDEFHTGKKDKYEFWFEPRKMGRYLYLRYYAVRDEEGKYLGCLEVAEDVTEIRAKKTEKRKI